MATTQIPSKQILDGSIVDADINGSAAIALSKLAESVIQADGGQTYTASQPMGGFKLTGLGAPTAASDSATKAYVDGLTLGLSWKGKVIASPTGNINLATSVSPNPVDTTVTLVDGDRVLLQNQTAPAENGIYDAVTAIDPATWTRATDMDIWAEVPSAAVFVAEGTANGDRAFNCTSDDGGTLETTAITWVQFAGSGATTAAAVSYDPTGDLVITNSTVQDALGDLDTAIGNRNYTDSLILTDSQTVTASLEALNVASGNQTYTNDFVVTDSQSFTASVDALDTAVGSRLYTTENKIADSQAISTSLEALDNAFTALEAVGAGTEGVTKVGDRAARYSNFTGGATLAATLTGIDTALGGFDPAETAAEEERSGSTSQTWILSATPNTTKGNLHVFLNGMKLYVGAGNDYTISTATITFNPTLVTADRVVASYYS